MVLRKRNFIGSPLDYIDTENNSTNNKLVNSVDERIVSLTNNRLKNSKKVIYTCILGNYDELKEPKIIHKDFDYICFTDNETITSNVWKIINVTNDLNDLDIIRKQRAYKMLPHKFLKNYDFSIYIDGNIDLDLI